MALPLFDFLQSGTSWGSSLISTFMDWPSYGSPPASVGDSHKKAARHRDSVVETDLCSSLIGLSVTRESPDDHAELSRPFAQSSLSASSDFSHASQDEVASSMDQAPLRISTLLQPNVRSGRCDFLNARSSERDPIRRPRAPVYEHPRNNRRRPRPDGRNFRYRSRQAVYRPSRGQEAEDPPPEYSAVDTLLAYPTDSRRDLDNRFSSRFFHDSNRPSAGHQRSSAVSNDGGERPRGERNSARNAKGTMKIVGRRVRVGMRNAKRNVREMPQAFLRLHKGCQISRARSKLEWLRRNGFLSDQERMLTHELRG